MVTNINYTILQSTEWHNELRGNREATYLNTWICFTSKFPGLI